MCNARWLFHLVADFGLPLQIDPSMIASNQCGDLGLGHTEDGSDAANEHRPARTERFPQPTERFAEWRGVVESRLTRPHPVGEQGYSDREDVSAPINTFVTYT